VEVNPFAEELREELVEAVHRSQRVLSDLSVSSDSPQLFP
jgi:hypothetical protein